MNPPIVIALAGWDPAGHAGLAADLRTLEALGCTGVGVATAQTVQSSVGMMDSSVQFSTPSLPGVRHPWQANSPVPDLGGGADCAVRNNSPIADGAFTNSRHVVPTAPGLLRAQLGHLLADITPSAVKVGMVGGIRQIAVMAELHSDADFGPMVLDPVLATSSGYELVSREGMAEMVKRMFPLAALVTPNLPEASALTDLPVSAPKRDLAAAVLALGCRAVLLKGGHGYPPTSDLLMTRDGAVEISGPMVDTPHLRGTGCRLSSAIAAHLAHGLDLDTACRSAKAWLTAGMTKPCIAGQGGVDGDRRSAQHRPNPTFGTNLGKVPGYAVT